MADHMDAAPKMTVIEGVQFVIPRMSALAAMNMQLRLVKLSAPIGKDARTLFADAGKHITTGKDGQPTISLDRGTVVEIVAAVVAEVDVELFQSIIVDLCESALVNGERVSFDAQFTADLIPAYILAFKVFQVNFERYLNALGLSIPATTGEKAQPTNSKSDDSSTS